MCQPLRAGPGGRVTRLLVTFLGSQLDKPRLFLVATNREHVNIAVIINAIVLYILVFMYLLEIKLLLLLLPDRAMHLITSNPDYIPLVDIIQGHFHKSFELLIKIGLWLVVNTECCLWSTGLGLPYCPNECSHWL